MEAIVKIHEEISEILCTLPKEKILDLLSSLPIPSENLASKTRLSLISLVSNYLEREEVGQLEDGGMAELLAIKDKLDELVAASVMSIVEGELVQGEGKELERDNSAKQLSQQQNPVELVALPSFIHSTPKKTLTSRQMDAERHSVSSPALDQKQSFPTPWHKDFKISGQIGEPGQKDRLSFSSLARQIETGLNKGYSNPEIIDAVIRAITPGLQLRSYLEGKTDLTLPTLRRILRSHYQEKGATELYKQLTAEAQGSKESPQSFLIRALDLRQKILFASQEAESGLKYDPALVQSMFLHTVLTGLQSDQVQHDLQPYLSDPNVTDEVLLERVNIACANETEKQNKRKTGSNDRTVSVSSAQCEGHSPEPRKLDKQKSDLWSQLKSLSDDLAQIKETIQQPVSNAQHCFAVSSKDNEVAPLPQLQQSPSRPYPPSQGCRMIENGQSCFGMTQLKQPSRANTTPSYSWKPKQTADSRVSHSPVVPMQTPTPPSYAVQCHQCSVPPQHPTHFNLPQYPNWQQPLFLSQPLPAPPQPSGISPHYSVSPPPTAATSHLPAGPRYFRPARSRQCFHCKQRNTEDPCSHCYGCGSSEHFLAGCRARSTRPQREIPLNENRLLPRDRQ